MLEELGGSLAEPKKLAPHQRVLLFRWCERCAHGPDPAAVPKASWAGLAQLGVGAIGDADKDVRAAAGALVAALYAAAEHGGGGGGGGSRGGPGARVLELVKTLEKKTQLKIAEQARALVSPDAGSASSEAVASEGDASGAERAVASSSSAPVRTASSSAVSKPSAREDPEGARPAAASKRARPPAAEKSGATKPATMTEPEPVGLSLDAASVEAAATRLTSAGVVSEEACATLVAGGSSKWSDRVEAMRALGDALANAGADDACGLVTLAEPVVVVLAAAAKLFKESNANVLAALFDVVRALAELTAKAPPGVPSFSRAAAAVCITPAVGKLADRKLAVTARAMLSALAEAIEPGFVASLVVAELEPTPASDARATAVRVPAPQARAEALHWLLSLVVDFGAAMVVPKVLAHFCATEAENKSPVVRSAAVKLVGALHVELGPVVRAAAITDETPAPVVKAIESEFEASPFDPRAATNAAVGRTKTARDVSAASAADAAAAVALPDLAALVSVETLLDDMGNMTEKNAWQKRKAAMDDVVRVCGETSHRLAPNKAVASVLRALKARLGDSQPNNKPLAATAIAELLASLESAAVCRFAKLVAPELIEVRRAPEIYESTTRLSPRGV